MMLYRILDAKDYEKFHRFLETNLHIITLFLVAEIKSFSLNLIREFSLITFKEYLKSSSNDQMYKVDHLEYTFLINVQVMLFYQ